MSTLRNNLLIAATVGLMAVGGCATTGGSLSSSATRLERNATALHDEAQDDDARSGFQRDARDLAEEAREFRRTVEDRSSSKEDVREAFSDVSKRYHAMRDEVERSRSREAEREFQPVTEAYLDVEREMRSRDDKRDRYASDE
jgi:coenzyme F420-reducing hydrogenase gamma subunit